MDAYEATRIVYSRIQSLDPENASKIMGLLLIQDQGEKEMIRLAFGPESLVHSVMVKARIELGLLPNTPSSPSPFHPLSLSRQNSSSSSNSPPSSSSSRHLGGGAAAAFNLPSPLSIPNPSSSPSSWSPSCFSTDHFHGREDLMSPSTNSTTIGPTSCSSSMNSSAPPFYASGCANLGTTTTTTTTTTDLIDEFQLHEQLSFLNDGSPTLVPKSSDLLYPQQPDLASSPSGDSLLFSGPNWAGGNGLPHHHHHRRSYSVSDACEDPNGLGFGWKPCLYFARGYCKNGMSCKFIHGDSADGVGLAVGSPTTTSSNNTSKVNEMMEQEVLLRSKQQQQQQQQQQRLAVASQLMAASSAFPYSPTKCINFFLQQQQQQQTDGQRAAAAMMLGEDIHKLGRTTSRLDRNDYSMNGVGGGGGGMVNPGSRQIYLTFPADSTFREEDVSNYFSIFGPVQDVRIPYQQKRMFGFVTFVYSETVKLILAKGNPHFVCDARVLVKPYKEKGKVPDKFRKQQQMDNGDFSACGSPTGLDSSRDPFDLHLGARMFYNTQDMLLRRKLEEQVDLQQAIELQGRRLLDLQLLDVKRQNHHRTLSTGAAIPSPTRSPNFFSRPFVLPSDRRNAEISEGFATENGFSPLISASATATDVTGEKEKQSLAACNGKESPHSEQYDLQGCSEHNLPDSPFASPRASANYMTAFSNAAPGKAEKIAGVLVTSSTNSNLITSTLLPATSTLDMASLKSCYFQAPRFSSGHGAIEM